MLLNNKDFEDELDSIKHDITLCNNDIRQLKMDKYCVSLPPPQDSDIQSSNSQDGFGERRSVQSQNNQNNDDGSGTKRR